jgi:hypothetical protein
LKRGCLRAFTAAADLVLLAVLRKAKMLGASRGAELFGLEIADHKTLAYREDMQEEQFR